MHHAIGAERRLGIGELLLCTYGTRTTIAVRALEKNRFVEEPTAARAFEFFFHASLPVNVGKGTCFDVLNTH